MIKKRKIEGFYPSPPEMVSLILAAIYIADTTVESELYLGKVIEQERNLLKYIQDRGLILYANPEVESPLRC